MEMGILCFHCHAIKNKNANQSIQKVIWEIKEDRYTKSLAKNQVCVIFICEIFRKTFYPNL